MLQLLGLLFSVFLLFAEFAGRVDEAHGIKQGKGIQGPFVHNWGQIKIVILGYPADDRVSSLTPLRVQNLVTPVAS